MSDYLFRRTGTNRAPWGAAILIAGIPGPEAVPPPNPVFVDQPQNARRTTARHSSYRFFSIKSGGNDEPQPIQTEYFPTRLLIERAVGYQRASANILFVGTTTPPLDQPHGIKLTELPSRAPGPRRTAFTGYDILVSPQIPDEVYGIKLLEMPSIARGWPRTANSAYLVLVPSLEDEPAQAPSARGHFSAPLRRALPQLTRSSPVAYAVPSSPTFPPADEVYGISITEIPTRAPAAQRTANVAYFVAQPPPFGEVEVPPITIGQVIPTRADGPMRSSFSSYVIAIGVPPADAAVPEVPFVPSEQPIPYETPEDVCTTTVVLSSVATTDAPVLSPTSRSETPKLSSVGKTTTPKLGSRGPCS